MPIKTSIRSKSQENAVQFNSTTNYSPQNDHTVEPILSTAVSTKHYHHNPQEEKINCRAVILDSFKYIQLKQINWQLSV